MEAKKNKKSKKVSKKATTVKRVKKIDDKKISQKIKIEEESVITPTTESPVMAVETVDDESADQVEHRVEVVEKGKEKVDNNEIPDVAADQVLSKDLGDDYAERAEAMNVPLEKKNKRLLVIGTFALVLIIVATGFMMYLRAKQGDGVDEEVVVEEVTEVVEKVEEVAEVTVEQLSRSEITVDVLNGSGVSGQAGKHSKILEDLGYEIGEVGNAESTIGNKIYVNRELEEKLEVFLSDSKSQLDVSSISGYLDDTEADARVVLGE